MFCGRKNTSKNALTPVLVFEDLGQGLDARMFLCSAHKPATLGDYRRWNKHHLMNEITNEQMAKASKRYAVKASRT
jgi:hypothetical protein